MPIITSAWRGTPWGTPILPWPASNAPWGSTPTISEHSPISRMPTEIRDALAEAIAIYRKALAVTPGGTGPQQPAVGHALSRSRRPWGDPH